MECHQSDNVRLIVAWFVVSAVAFGTPSGLAADETETPVFPTLNWGTGTEEIQANLGVPAFAADSILMYATEILTTEGAVAADLTLWFRADKLFFASYAFQIAGRSDDELSTQFESISERLRAAYDEPSSRASTPGSFTTEVWNLDELDIEHTLILDPGRVDHVVTVTAPQD